MSKLKEREMNESRKCQGMRKEAKEEAAHGQKHVNREVRVTVEEERGRYIRYTHKQNIIHRYIE